MSHGHSFLLHAAAFACPSDVLFGSVILVESEYFSSSWCCSLTFCGGQFWISCCLNFWEVSHFVLKTQPVSSYLFLYNCILSDSGAHMVQLKCLLWKKKRWRSWLCWLKWSKLPESTSSLLTLTWERVVKNDVSMGIVWFFRIAQLPVPEASGVPRVLPVSSAGWQLASLDEESHSCQCH